MILSLVIFWAIPVAAIFGGTAFKPIQSYLWTCCGLLAFYFCTMSPLIADAVFGIFPASWTEGREGMLMLVIVAPIFTFLLGVIIHTCCPVDFGVFRLPKGFNLVVSGVNGLLFGILLTDLLLLIIFSSNIHKQFPEEYNERFRRLTLSRSMVSVSIINRALNNSDMNVSCRKNLERLLYQKHEKVEAKKISLGVAERVTSAVFGRTMKTVEILNEAMENSEATAKAKQQLGELLSVDVPGGSKQAGEEKTDSVGTAQESQPKAPVERKRMQIQKDADGNQTYKSVTPVPKSSKRSKTKSSSSGPTSIYGRSLQKARNVRAATEARSQQDAAEAER